MTKVRNAEELMATFQEVIQWSQTGMSDESFWASVGLLGIDRDAFAQTLFDHSRWPEMLADEIAALLVACRRDEATSVEDCTTKISTMVCCEAIIAYIAGLLNGREDALDAVE